MKFWGLLPRDKYSGQKQYGVYHNNLADAKAAIRSPFCRFRSVCKAVMSKVKTKSLLYVMAPLLLLASYVGIVLGVPFLAPAVAATTPQSLNTFIAASSLSTGLIGATATLLDNGDVLVAGGNTGSVASPSATDTAELYSPTTGTFVSTAPMPTALYDATATLLDNGDVLVAGGLSSSGSALASAELYNPTSASWTSVSPMAIPRFDAAATVLGNGEVLIAGGQTGSLPSTSTTTTSSTTT
ncbi:MAG: hypothetical protein M1374_07050, partial [Firmicutes bacterium]|nr:hypothetical protein [Bacillota bacterium]